MGRFSEYSNDYESKLYRAIEAVYVPLMEKKFGGTYWTFFPDPVFVSKEPRFVEIDFSLSGLGELSEQEIEAIATVFGVDVSRVEEDYLGGGCDSCGFGARTVVRVLGAELPEL